MAQSPVPRDWLSGESSRWVQSGLISEPQRTAILGLYPADAPKQSDRTVLILTILGSVLLGVGVILFFASNWPRIPSGVKLGAIIAAIVAAYGSGYYLQYVRGDYPRLGQSLIFLGSLFYGAGVWLVAQIYHLDSHYPNGFLLWAVGALPIAWVTSSQLVLYLSTAVLAVWTVTEQAAFESFNFLFPVLLVAGVLPLARRLNTALAEAAVPVGLFLWFAINVAAHGAVPDPYGPLVIARVMMLFGVAAMLLSAAVTDSRPYLGVGAPLALLGAYVLTFSNRPWETPPPAPHLFAGSGFLVGGTVVLLAAVAGGVLLQIRRRVDDRVPLLTAAGLFVVGAFVAHLLPDVARMIAFNLLLFAGTLSLTMLGIRRRSELLVNLGLLAFVIHVITRYFDLFFAAMDRSLFFMLGGILLLVGGWWLERNRRRWLKGGGAA